ncbi:MAG: fumarylacetoacetate hydrolase family protein [Endozoicomonas sp.]
MKFASLNKGPDGQILLVSRDLQWAITIPGVGPNLRDILDQWEKLSPSIEEGYQHLNAGEWNDAIHFDPACCTAPLPRASQWLKDSSSLQSHELESPPGGQAISKRPDQQPQMYRGCSDNLLGPREDITGKVSWGVDFQASIAVITDRVPMGCTVEDAHKYIRLVTLCNDITMRNLIPGELSTGLGLIHSKPYSSFSPVAVTPDELGDHWQDGRLNLDIRISFNDTLFGGANRASQVRFNFHEMIACAATTRHLSCGTVISADPVSGIAGGTLECFSLAEQMRLKALRQGASGTDYMQEGDRVKMEILDPDGQSIFGAIEQTLRVI